MSHTHTYVAALTLSVGLPTILVVTEGCSAAQRREEKRVIDYLCVLEHATLATPAIALACSVEEALVPLIEPFLAAHQRAALRQYGPLVVPSASGSSSAAPLVTVPILPPAPPKASASTSSSAPPAASSATPAASATAKKKK
jgi:hypothetical protein